MKYYAKNDFRIMIPLLCKEISSESFTDEDVDFLKQKWPGKYDHNFGLVGEESEVNEVAEVKEGASKSYPSDEPNKDWTVEQLKDFASDNGIKLGRAKTEDSILKAIKRALENG